MKNSLMIGILFILFMACKKNTIENVPITIQGTWVETSHKTDTLVFNDELQLFDLKGGTELRNEIVEPKYKSRIFSYEIEKDSISLQWILSSSSSRQKYYYKIDSKNEQMSIGNFFVDSLNQNVTLTFSRKR